MDSKLSDLKDKAQDKASELKEKAQGAWNDAKDKAQDVAEGVKDTAREAKDQVQDVAGSVKETLKEAKDKAAQAGEDSGAKDDLEALRADLKALRADVTGLMGSLKGAASSTVKEVAAGLSDTGEQLGGQIKETLSTLKNKGGDLTHNLEERVQERPLMSVLIAFGLGLVLSRMLERR